MELTDGVLRFEAFLSVTFGIVVLFVGKRLNESFNLLREASIPEPVSGGLLFTVLFSLLYSLSGVRIEFDLNARDFLLVYFFTTIGINASFKDLIAGGKPLVILVAITVGYMFLQNLTGISITALFGLPTEIGLLAGTVSLIGGYGTAIAWSPKFIESTGVANAMELGIACATFGLILASLMGGPIAKFLISRNKLSPPDSQQLDMGLPEKRTVDDIDHLDVLDAILSVHICIIVGGVLDGALNAAGLELPLFVSCLFAGIILSNTISPRIPRLSGKKWPSRTPVMAIISEISLGTFLAMSLMSLQLWTLFDLAAPILAVLTVQFALAVAVNVFVVFPAMGRRYDAAIVCAGFGGISLGSTPTAMANMAAVTKRYGASHLAFIVVPLVCAFFIDLANALIIPLFLWLF